MKKIMSIFLCISILLSLCSCNWIGDKKSTDTDTLVPVSSAYILSPTSNFPMFSNENITPLFTALENVCKAGISKGADVSFIINDGKAHIGKFQKIDSITTDITDSKRQSKISSKTYELAKIAIGLKAKTEETDLLKSLDIATNQVNASRYNNKEIYIFANGICTSGIINMTDEAIINSDVQEIVKQLKEMNAIPDMSNISVIHWYGLGMVCGAQNEISASSKQWLKNLWEAIIIAGNSSVTFAPDNIEGEADSELPKITPINFPQDKLNVSALDKGQGITISESNLEFVSDSNVFKNVSQANSTLEPIAEYLKINTDISIVLIGSTASVDTTDEYCNKLSLSRAEAVKKALNNMGVNNNIKCYGIGRKKCDLRKNDLAPDGSLIEDIAKQNRFVMVLVEGSDECNDALSNI